MLAQYGPSMSQISDLCCHVGEYSKVYDTNLYCCDKGSIIEMDGDYWIVLDNWGYDVVVERLYDGVRECRLPTVGCLHIGNVVLKNKEQISC